MKTKAFITFIAAVIFITITSFQNKYPLKGVWNYDGGTYNGKTTGAPKDRKIQRVYNTTGYQAIMTGADGKGNKYEAGNYSIKNNEYTETQTFSAEASPLKGKTIRYTWYINGNRLTIKGKLPDNSPVEEYWVRLTAF